MPRVLIAPLLAVVAVIVLFRLGRPVRHRSERVGRHEASFVSLKLQTMTEECGPDGRPLPDAARLTSVGSVLRSLSLDELPQRWNVTRGAMSLVGPRPLPCAYLARYTPTERRRHDVRPRMTGWAQVQGRKSVSWDDRLVMDVWYVDHRGSWLDLRIILRTAAASARRDGISAGDHARMPDLRPELDEGRG